MFYIHSYVNLSFLHSHTIFTHLHQHHTIIFHSSSYHSLTEIVTPFRLLVSRHQRIHHHQHHHHHQPSHVHVHIYSTAQCTYRPSMYETYSNPWLTSAGTEMRLLSVHLSVGASLSHSLSDRRVVWQVRRKTTPMTKTNNHKVLWHRGTVLGDGRVRVRGGWEEEGEGVQWSEVTTDFTWKP